MLWQPVLIAIACVSLYVPAFGDSSSLESFARQTVSIGTPNRVPSPIAEQIDVPADAPVHILEIGPEQATDGMNHLFRVLVELSTTTPRRPIRPLGVVLSTYRIEGGSAEQYWYRSTLRGKLESAMLIDGRVDDNGVAIKGSGSASRQDVESQAIKDRFQHELDLWLKKTYLKKAWRSAEFSGGVLKKKGKPSPGIR